MKRFAHWRVTLTFGRMNFACYETAPTEVGAIAAARRYAAAIGYSGEPDRTRSRRIF